MTLLRHFRIFSRILKITNDPLFLPSILKSNSLIPNSQEPSLQTSALRKLQTFSILRVSYVSSFFSQKSKISSFSSACIQMKILFFQFLFCPPVKSYEFREHFRKSFFRVRLNKKYSPVRQFGLKNVVRGINYSLFQHSFHFTLKYARKNLRKTFKIMQKKNPKQKIRTVKKFNEWSGRKFFSLNDFSYHFIFFFVKTFVMKIINKQNWPSKIYSVAKH